MCNSRHADHLGVVIDDIDDAPVANPDTPLIFVALKLLGESSRDAILVTTRARTVSGKASSSFFAEGFIATK